ncbi:TIGR00341 family protein [Megalodesulfovibrio paquesii]
MALRLLEIVVHVDVARHIMETLDQEEPTPPHWLSFLDGELAQVRVVLDMESLEQVTDLIEQRHYLDEASRILVLPLEAVIPRLIKPEPEGDTAADPAAEAANADGPPSNAAANGKDSKEKAARRLHREELYSSLYDQARLSRNHLLLVVLSALVAAMGLVRNSEVVLVGAMVIAPMLGPQLALAFAASLGDAPLMRHAARTTAASIALALLATTGLGMFLQVDPGLPSVALRTSPSLGDLALALAAGAAGTLCFTMGQATAVVGVMVAVALMPPLAAAGLLVGEGEWRAALGALALTGANIIGINAAGVAVCLYQGVRPGAWWEQQQAARTARRALALWVLLLAAMAAVLTWMYRPLPAP